MTEKIPFNHHWRYIAEFTKDYIDRSYCDYGFFDVNIPHTNLELPYNSFDEKSYQFISTYRKHFRIPDAYEGKRVFIDFAGVMIYAEVFINGHFIGSHKGGFTPFSFELTEHIDYQNENVIVAMVDSTERADIPPFGNEVDYLCFGGIYREVELRFADQNYISDIFVRTPKVLSDTKLVNATVVLEKEASGKAKFILSQDEKIIKCCDINFCAAKEFEIIVQDINDIKLWDLDEPNLYDISIEINGDFTDVYRTRSGFREVLLTPEGFFLNGRNIKLMGLDRHQSYPYVGYAMPERAQKKDADILKYELGLNCVRTSHYPQSKHFLDRCDEIGLLVFEEVTGWQHIGDDEWKEVTYAEINAMIKRDFNHPSIFSWGVRINESLDDHDFYLKTNALAHALDDTHQTGGVRAITHSEFLEDIYTTNDFIHSGGEIILRNQQEVTGLDYNVPYLVTEYCGHMFPTKRYDQEERLVEHTLRHLRIQNASYGNPAISGALGWCAFDYNTHSSFGSGDRICYHGVSDIFRIPKFAAFAYQSQLNPSERLVLEPVTLWARGDRDGGSQLPVLICTNCDYVAVYMDGKKLGTFYPDKEKFKHLPHPPVIIGGFEEGWGMRVMSPEFVGYIEGKEVIRKNYSNAPVPFKLIAQADDENIYADGIDVTRVVYKLVDQKGNLLPYINEYIELEVVGEGSIIGPSKTALIGGCIGVWVKSSEKSGTIILKAKCSRFTANEVIILTV